MVEIKCMIIPEPDEKTRAIFRQPPSTKIPFFTGHGPNSYLCGNCGFTLARNVNEDEIQGVIHTSGGLGLVLLCPECKSFNELGLDIG